VILYCRVSTRQQEEEGTSLDTQEARGRAYAEARGWQITAVYREQHSGGELWERPMLTEAREMIRDGAADVLLSYAVDRLSRKQTHLAIVIEEVEGAGGRALFVTEDFEQSAIGTFLRSAIAFAAEFEREKIAERTARGLLQRAQDGKMRPGCRALFGYQWRPVPAGTSPELAKKLPRAALDINPDTAPVVERIIREIAGGATLRGLATRLDAEGVPTPNGAAHWHPSTLRAFCFTPMYAGTATAHRRVVTRGNGKRHYAVRPLDEQIALPAGTVPAIVSPELLSAAQERLSRNKEQAPRNNRNPEAFLLRGGFIVGGCCGKRVHTGWSKRDSKQTPLRGVYRVRTGVSGHDGCPSLGITAATLDDAVWRRVRALFLQPEIIEREVERLRTDDPTVADRAAVEQSLAAITKQQTNLTRTIATLDDADASAPLVDALKAAGARKRELEAECAALEARREAWAATQMDVGPLAPWIARVAANLDTMTYDEKRDLLATLRVRVTVYPMAHTPRWQITAAVPLPQSDGDIVFPTPRCCRSTRSSSHR
jgi:site-specific DNA recombinase